MTSSCVYYMFIQSAIMGMYSSNILRSQRTTVVVLEW